MQWFSPHPERWYLRLHQPLPITAVSKMQAIGHKISKDLNSAQYATMLNEIQMLLHQHAANIAREEAGLLPLNSVWLWGRRHLCDACFSVKYSALYRRDGR